MCKIKYILSYLFLIAEIKGLAFSPWTYMGSWRTFESTDGGTIFNSRHFSTIRADEPEKVFDPRFRTYCPALNPFPALASKFWPMPKLINDLRAQQGTHDSGRAFVFTGFNQAVSDMVDKDTEPSQQRIYPFGK